MPTDQFNLREIQPSDGPWIAKLITEFDDDLTTRFLVDPYQAVIQGTEFRTSGVVVEAEGCDGFVGMGTVRFSTVQFNGAVLPLAFLDGLKVQKVFRGKGLGYQIAAWRIKKAREEYGGQCVIGTGMLHDNHASHAVAKKWCREFAESAFEVRVVPTRAKQPGSVEEIRVREIQPREYEEFAEKQNEYYSRYNLFPPCSPESILRALDVSAEGRRPYRYFVAVDSRGNLLAGAQTWARGMLKSDTVNNLPPALRTMNKLVHLLPDDFIIRDVGVNGIWHEKGEVKAVRYLWEMMRWLCRDHGTTLAVSFDKRDPALTALPFKPWHQPRPKITFAIHAPTLLNREQLLFASGRV